MRTKLTLKLEALSVDSFDTTAAPGEKGTVFGEQCTCPSACTCPGCPSCDATCPATCPYTCDDATCGGSCGETCPATCENTCESECYRISLKYTNCNYACY